MVGTLERRGPDAKGLWLSPRAALGHRRLAVVDPVGGSQPMLRKVGDRLYVLTYNGELYNTAALRTELETRGHHFETQSDTEVLLVAFIEWGAHCVEKLNGIFAFGIWDDAAQELFLARDRFGVKPLFYTQRETSFLFGSELKVLLKHPLVPARMDRAGLSEILFLGPSRTPGSGVFQGIAELRPGHFLRLTPDGLQIRTYWQLESRPHQDDQRTTVATVRELVTDAIRRQLVSDVPLATLLSGGLDSSTITAVAARAFEAEGRPPLHTWSIDYVDNDQHFQANAFQPNADAPFIRQVSDCLGTVHHSMLIDTPELVGALKEATLARDLPGMADIDASLLLFCRAIKEQYTVVLSGECADEVFGGYPWFHRADLLTARSFPWVRSLSERVALLRPEWQRTLDATGFVQERYEASVAACPKLPGEDPLEARRREMFYLNLHWFMATLLDRKDRMSMAVGLEARVPFCDHRIVEYVWNIPWAMKMADGREKGILRLAVDGLLPDEIVYRKKSPYPKTHNPAYFRAVRDWALQLLDDPTSPLHQIWEADAVRALAEQEASASGLPWFGQLMGTAQFFAFLGQVDTWMRHYKVELV
jgi:asparagine synthase (glutamine-hydrolysing)